MVATSVPLATQIGLDVLKKGGTAVDAAIAANAALGLMEPVSNGVGGDLFAIVWDAKTKKLYGYNGSGRSPKSLTLQYFNDHDIKEIPAHEGFDEAWNDAIEQAKELWHKPGAPRVEIPVTVEYIARIDIWNPGGIGQYHVKITPTG